MDHPEYFFVTSYGRTATVWLTQALNLHPDIICSHGPSFVPVIARNGVPYTEQAVVDAQNSASQFCAQSLRQILAHLQTKKNGACRAGNVHGFSARALWLRSYTESRVPAFCSVNLLRHPVTRVDSFWRRWRYEHGFNSPATRWIETEMLQKLRYRKAINELQSYHYVTLKNFEEKAFFYAVMQMSNDDQDLHTGMPQILSEKLVSDMDYFTYTFRLLMGDSIPLSKEYLHQVECLGKQNQAEGSGRDAEQVFREWQSWQRTLFMMFLRDHPKLETCYTNFGYHLPQPDSSSVRIKEKSELSQVFQSLGRSHITGVLRNIGGAIIRNHEFPYFQNHSSQISPGTTE